MKRAVGNLQFVLMSLIAVYMALSLPVSGYAQVPVPAVQESITVSTSSPLTEATLDGSEVTVTLAGRTFERSIFDIRRAVSVSGIAGVSVGTFGITRASDTKLTIELEFSGDFDEEGTLTFTVGSGAIASYNGAALTRDVSVPSVEETVEASTASPLTEATLDGSVVTLTLAGRAFESSIFDVRDGVSVSGIAGVSVGTFGVQRASDSKVTVELDFNGNIDTDGSLTFTVGSGAIQSYNGAALTAELTVSARTETVTATTASPLTEATLNGTVVTLTLSGARYVSSIFDVRDGVSVSGITGVSVGTFGVRRVSDTVATVELTFNGNLDNRRHADVHGGRRCDCELQRRGADHAVAGKCCHGNGDGDNGVAADGGDAGRQRGHIDTYGRHVRKFHFRRSGWCDGIGHYRRERGRVRCPARERHEGDRHADL